MENQIKFIELSNLELAEINGGQSENGARIFGYAIRWTLGGPILAAYDINGWIFD